MSGKYVVPFPGCDVLHQNLSSAQKVSRAYRIVHFGVADSSMMFPLNISIRMNLPIKKKKKDMTIKLRK